jgi:uncharacterized membrane protein YagU involved in acid resistance
MNVKRAVAAGLVGTTVMTGLMLVAPMVGLPRMAIGELLSTLLAVSTAFLPTGPAVGWLIHAAFGVALALIYAGVFAGRLPGKPIARGALYGFLVFLLAQLLFMPLVGGGVFSRGEVPMILGSLIGHLVYGGLVGAIYGDPMRAAERSAPPRMA